MQMNMPNFHDGYFDGLWLGSDKFVRLFLRTCDHQSYTLTLQGVQALAISGVRAGNIIMDLVFRSAREITPSDVRDLYDVDSSTEQAAKLLKSTREKELQILELNSSYGAQGLLLFETCEINETVDKMALSVPSTS
jgi:hypothetical protein